jgi:hypothetical protein
MSPELSSERCTSVVYCERLYLRVEAIYIPPQQAATRVLLESRINASELGLISKMLPGTIVHKEKLGELVSAFCKVLRLVRPVY